MGDQRIELMAHLMRRAGFGATRDELEELVPVGYESVVERLLHPDPDQSGRLTPDYYLARSRPVGTAHT